MSITPGSVGTFTINAPATHATGHPYELHVVAEDNGGPYDGPHGVRYTIAVCYTGTGTGHEGHTWSMLNVSAAREILTTWMPGNDAGERRAAAHEVVAHALELALVGRRFRTAVSA